MELTKFRKIRVSTAGASDFSHKVAWRLPQFSYLDASRKNHKQNQYYVIWGVSALMAVVAQHVILLSWCPAWARERCRISPPRFLAECCKRQLNQGSFVMLYFRLFTFSDLYWVCLSVFSRTVLFVSISQVIGCEDRLRNDLCCVEWGVKLYSNQPT